MLTGSIGMRTARTMEKLQQFIALVIHPHRGGVVVDGEGGDGGVVVGVVREAEKG
jgi:hypothetical protein